MNWTRKSTIGRGSTATVSLAMSSLSGELFAAKSAELSLSNPLLKEQSILSKLDSPYIVKYKGFDITQEKNDHNKLYYNLFMEYLPRGTLFDEIRRRGGKLEESMIRSYTWQILQGLVYLHENGIVHCDIKTTNILMGNDENSVKISDFGCSKLHNGDDNLVGFCGTPMYMSPEVILGQELGFECDTWSLGCTVIEMATGKNPWPQVNDPISALYQIGFSGESPEFPSWLSQKGRDFLGKCLKRNPKERSKAKELLKHPFFEDLLGFDEKERVINNVSPTSVFDQSVWDSFEVLNPNSHHDHDHHQHHDQVSSLAMRIESLVSSSVSDWSLESVENWVAIRSNDEIISDVNFPNEHVNNSIIISTFINISRIRKRGYSIAFDESIKNDVIVPINLKLFKKGNENFSSFQYIINLQIPHLIISNILFSHVLYYICLNKSTKQKVVR